MKPSRAQIQEPNGRARPEERSDFVLVELGDVLAWRKFENEKHLSSSEVGWSVEAWGLSMVSGA